MVYNIAFIAVWTMDDLIADVGSVNRIAALKALLTWVDLGVLKEEDDHAFRLLERAEQRSTGAARHRTLYIISSINCPDVDD